MIVQLHYDDGTVGEFEATRYESSQHNTVRVDGIRHTHVKDVVVKE